jgi:type II secretory pathway component PulM
MPDAGEKRPGARAAGGERYEPMPGLLSLPGFLLRKLSPTGRRIVAALGVLVVLAVVAGLVLGRPAVDRRERERAAVEARERAAAQAEQRRALAAEARPVRGRGPAAGDLRGAEALRARQGAQAALEAAVLADARARVRAGRLRSPVRRVACEAFPRRTDGRDPASIPALAQGRYACLAVTAEVGRANATGAIGYPYRALLAFPTGRFAFCKISGQAGELALGRQVQVGVPRACGGTG